jgi:aspartate aminotransferase
MKPINVSPRLLSLAESLTLAVDVKVQERQARGEDIVNLGVGQPDFPTPAFVREAAARAVEAGATRYTPPGGTTELRRAAARFFRERSGVAGAEPGNTLVTCGAKHALYEAMAAVLSPGDEVLLPVPYWVSYPEQVKLTEAVARPVAPTDGLKVTPADLDRVAGPATRMLLMNSPNNPSGQVYTRAEVEALTEWCLRRGVLILSDEIYDRLVFDGAVPVSPASLGPEAAAATITVNGVSKSHSMTGWRIGFLTGPREVVNAVVRFQGQTTGNPAAASQAAALAALEGSDEVVEEMRRAYQARRDLVMAELGGMSGLELAVPRGAFYAFPRVTEAVRATGSSVALAERLVEAGVAVVPGAGFGADEHVRLSFAVSDERLREGILRFRRGLEALLSRTGTGSRGD